jgi:hypothetical protein
MPFLIAQWRYHPSRPFNPNCGKIAQSEQLAHNQGGKCQMHFNAWKTSGRCETLSSMSLAAHL